MDVSKIKPMGPWILVKMESPPDQTEGGVYLPQGNLMERLGYSVGLVLAAGPGEFNQGKAAVSAKYKPIGVSSGDRVVFRGYLQEANRPGGVIDREHSLIHVSDVIGVLLDDARLEPALPYDN
jgi:co-chaperonin GroES (HSP10)